MFRLTIYLLAASLTLAACNQTPLIVGRPGGAVDPEGIRIYYAKRPACRYETLAEFSVSGYFSLQSMFRNLRRDAAALGADAIYVVHTQQTEMKEFLGSAKAIRCLAA